MCVSLVCACVCVCSVCAWRVCQCVPRCVCVFIQSYLPLGVINRFKVLFVAMYVNVAFVMSCLLPPVPAQ